MADKTGKAFDLQIFLRLMSFAKRYKLNFFIATASTILLAIVALINPILIKETVDKYITEKDSQGLINNILLMFGIVLLEVLCYFTVRVLSLAPCPPPPITFPLFSPSA